MKKIFFFGLIALFWACGSQDTEERKDGSETVTVEEDAIPGSSVKSLSPQEVYKQEMDSLVQHQRIFIQTFVRTAKSDALVEVYETDDWPDEKDITAVYQLSFRPNGSTQFFAERPYGPEGRNVQFTHYFDEANRTIAFEKYVIYTDNLCTSGAAIETDINYYDTLFAVTGSMYTLTDEDLNNLQGTECLKNGIQEYTVFSTYEKLAEQKGTKVFLNKES